MLTSQTIRRARPGALNEPVLRERRKAGGTASVSSCLSSRAASIHSSQWSTDHHGITPHPRTFIPHHHDADESSVSRDSRCCGPSLSASCARLARRRWRAWAATWPTTAATPSLASLDSTSAAWGVCGWFVAWLLGSSVHVVQTDNHRYSTHHVHALCAPTA
jgi:hypothetical protein